MKSRDSCWRCCDTMMGRKVYEGTKRQLVDAVGLDELDAARDGERSGDRV